jgi:hypothetical protein
MNDHVCPICEGPLEWNERYPLAVCQECIIRTEDGKGRRVQFFNTSLSGGLTSRYIDDGSLNPFDLCRIAGIRCRASEAHLGGIVIEVL